MQPTWLRVPASGLSVPVVMFDGVWVASWCAHHPQEWLGEVVVVTAAGRRLFRDIAVQVYSDIHVTTSRDALPSTKIVTSPPPSKEVCPQTCR